MEDESTFTSEERMELQRQAHGEVKDRQARQMGEERIMAQAARGLGERSKFEFMFKWDAVVGSFWKQESLKAAEIGSAGFENGEHVS